jgi:hypothetical protein
LLEHVIAVGTDGAEVAAGEIGRSWHCVEWGGDRLGGSAPPP